MPITTFPDPTNITSAVSTFQYANSITDTFFMPAIIFTVWIVLFMTLKVGRTEAAFGASLYITMIITILARGAGLVSDAAVVTVILAFLASVFFVMFRGDA